MRYSGTRNRITGKLKSKQHRGQNYCKNKSSHRQVLRRKQEESFLHKEMKNIAT